MLYRIGASNTYLVAGLPTQSNLKISQELKEIIETVSKIVFEIEPYEDSDIIPNLHQSREKWLNKFNIPQNLPQNLNEKMDTIFSFFLKKSPKVDFASKFISRFIEIEQGDLDDFIKKSKGIGTPIAMCAA